MPNETMQIAGDAMTRALDQVRPQMAEVEAKLHHLPDIEPPALREAVQRIVASGGKRIRPVITLLIAGMLGNENDPRIIDLASAVELLHTATLVHDDLIDGSLVRRGAATLNAAWTPAATVLTGDYLFSVAAGLASRTDDVRVMRIFSDTLGVIVAGELQQQFTDFALRATREDYYRRIYNKTASMFVLAGAAAGVISAATDAQFAALRDFGRDLGIAFQVMDDVLDFTGEQVSIGKPVGSDLRRGLITLPVIAYIERHGLAGLECALRGECDPQTYDRIIALIRESDAIDAALQEAEGIAQNARRTLVIFPDNHFRTALLDLVDFSLQRKK